MSMTTRYLPLAQVDVDDLPPDVIDELPRDIIQQLQDGVLDKIPDNIVDSLPPSIQDKIPDGLVEAAASNSAFTKVLLAIGIIAVLGFMWGIFRSAVKWMIYSAILAVGSWYLFFQQ
ncbi:MAG: hypothetical protein U9N84_11265 [Actinomycetota bacterium]|nr:hypothetical protein [Actinomycetota bacterium]